MAPMPLDRTRLPDVALRGAVVATTRMSRHLAADGAERTKERGPVHVFLVSHPTQGPVLIDAGFGRRTAVDPTDHPGKLSTRILDLRMDVPMADRIGDLGYHPDDVRTIVLTHIHDDHAAGVEDFPEATLWTGRADRAFADRKRSLRGIDPAPFTSRLFAHPDYADGPWGPFESHTDLFDDGSVLVFPAPGHTPGSQLVLVNTREHSWLFQGDTAWTDDAWNGPEPVPKGDLPRSIVETDWRKNIDALWRVQRLVGNEEITLVSGHEPDDIRRMPEWPTPWTMDSWSIQ